MWREKILFYSTLFFICGNLTTDVLSTRVPITFIALYCVAALLVIIILSIIAIAGKRGTPLLFIPVFFLTGCINYGQVALFGEINVWRAASELEFILDWRGNFTNYLAEIIPPEERDELSILNALTTGNKGMIPYELKEAYRTSGAMHLLALSGMHVGLIYAILSKISSLVIPSSPVGKGIKGVAITLSLLFFALFTGASPSICRAVLMVAVYESATVLGRDKNGINALSISALIITLLNPEAPTSISFQLSYCAMLGIFLIHPHLKKLIGYICSKRWCIKIWEMLSISISCQIFTTPLTLFYFKTFAIATLFTNIVAMPLVTFVMVMISLSLVIVRIPYIGEIASSLLHLSIKTLNTIIEIISFF